MFSHGADLPRQKKVIAYNVTKRWHYRTSTLSSTEITDFEGGNTRVFDCRENLDSRRHSDRDLRSGEVWKTEVMIAMFLERREKNQRNVHWSTNLKLTIVKLLKQRIIHREWCDVNKRHCTAVSPAVNTRRELDAAAGYQPLGAPHLFCLLPPPPLHLGRSRWWYNISSEPTSR